MSLPHAPKIGDIYRVPDSDAVYLFVGPTSMQVGDELKPLGVVAGIYAGNSWVQIRGRFAPLAESGEIGRQ